MSIFHEDDDEHGHGHEHGQGHGHRRMQQIFLRETKHIKWNIHFIIYVFLKANILIEANILLHAS
jgi:hypothetical protein